MSLSSILDVGLGDDVARYGFLSPLFYCFDFVSTVPVAGEVLLVVLLFLCSALHALIPELYEMAKTKFLRSPDVYVERSISVHLSTLVMGMVGNRNALLQNAILFYLYHNFWRLPLSPSVWKDKASLLLLVDPLRNSWEERYDSPFRVSSFEDSDDAYCEDVHWRSRRELERYIVVRISTDGSWVPVSKDGVEMTYNRKRENVDGTEGVLRTVILRAKGNADAAARIEAFLNSALEYYINKLPSVMNEGRVFLEMQPSLKERDGSVHVRFKRYPLADDKTFDTLFFPEKSKILSLVDDFIAKKGRFAIDGFPYKLGFLLYGPPGSGKTAFVKALAAYTGRHVVSVNLSFLHSNQDLYDIFLNREYQCIGESDVTIFGVEDVIFLLDNVDASRSLVRSRVRKRYVRKCRSRTLTASEKDESARLCGKADGDDEKVMVTVSSDSDGDNDSNNDDEGGGSMKNVSDDEDVSTAGGAAFCDKNVKIFNQLMLGAIDSQSPAESSGAWAVSPAQDKLVESSLMKLLQSSTAANLSGLLNVLDGAVDSPGRIVVMITKNPERLDPALVRPGRFSHKLHLDYMQMPALLSMLGLHFGTVDVGDGTKDDGEKLAGSLITMYAGAKIKNKATQLPRLSSADTERVRLFISALEKEKKSNSENERSEGFRITPAEIESLCTVSTSLDEFLNLFKSYLTNNSGSNSSNNNNRKENEE